ncbi:UNVERIFIED_CONTAM: hypothetical protein K2H54_033004 [Gekko kuhli]
MPIQEALTDLEDNLQSMFQSTIGQTYNVLAQLKEKIKNLNTEVIELKREINVFQIQSEMGVEEMGRAVYVLRFQNGSKQKGEDWTTVSIEAFTEEEEFEEIVREIDLIDRTNTMYAKKNNLPREGPFKTHKACSKMEDEALAEGEKWEETAR